MFIKCPEYILTAIKLLEKSGFKAFIVGGCVRDSIMGNIPDDWDMTTNASPEEIISVFSQYKTVPTGIKHGTVTVIIDGNKIEITTMRIDGEYSDNRRPDSVKFTDDITVDLSRRDFTVNAIAYNPLSGITDPFNGTADIKRKTIKCVGNPDKRFDEDALRILRAVRFASVLGFTIDNETKESIIRKSNLLNNVAKERIRNELLKLLCGKNAEKILLDYRNIIFTIIPELEAENNFEQHTPYHIYDVWTHTAKVVASVKNTYVLRMSALLHDIGKPQKFYLDASGTGHFKGHPELSAKTAEKILKELHFSNAEIKQITQIILLHDRRPNGDKKQIAHLCAEYSPEIVNDTIELMKADTAAKSPDLYDKYISACNTAQKQISEIIDNNECISLKSMAINGNDLLAVGIKGEKIKIILNTLLDMIIDDKVQNNENELIDAAFKIL